MDNLGGGNEGVFLKIALLLFNFERDTALEDSTFSLVLCLNHIR